MDIWKIIDNWMCGKNLKKERQKKDVEKKELKELDKQKKEAVKLKKIVRK